MIVVSIAARDGSIRRLEFDKPEITIGRVQGNDIVIGKGNVSKRHARLVVRQGKYIIVDLKSTNGTYVNGRRITSPLVIEESDLVFVGDYKLTFSVEEPDDEPTLEVDATELRLLAAITQRDEASRTVYADWLEEHGDLARAEFLRVQEALVVAQREADQAIYTHKLRELAPSIDVGWRYKVARPAIERCLAFEFECPKEWGSLATTERSNVRYCGACAKQVFYCTTVNEARAHADRNECVAVDVANLRRPRDLEPERPVMMMGAVMPYRPEPPPPRPPPLQRALPVVPPPPPRPPRR